MTPREQDEYRALRDTIRERGSARVWIFVIGVIAWAALVIATAALAALPIATLLPLLVLAGVFEAVFALHVGVERIGRYLQVFYEDDAPADGPEAGVGTRNWEHVVMAFGRDRRGTATDPLFTLVFLGAAVLNFVPALLADPVAIEVLVVGSAHLLFAGRLVAAHRAAGRQREADLGRFQGIKRGA